MSEIIRALPSSTHIPEAIEELNMMLKLKPNESSPNEILAEIYYYLGEKDKGDYYKAMAEKNSLKNDS